ncbi:MAG TPA: lysylphosphatidylglycerol synthase transmembrane domain-containing protein [Gaiellaceae bacterium]|nr:lysylphosphatidylglycerol synthase transmembrane domain-containing protein [Gaiellaceae bacterium]
MASISYAGFAGQIRSAAAYLRAHRSLSIALQIAIVVATIAFCAWAVRSEWAKAAPLLRHAHPGYVVLAFAAVAAYYLVFILGWIRMLAAWGIDVGYRVALRAEMVSMLAKYLPGGIWTPAARTVALRRSGGVTDTPTVLASILVEAALSAISGVIVFVVSLAWVRGVDAPLLPLVAFAILCALLLHPRIFRRLGNYLLKPFGAGAVDPLPFPLMLGLLLFYCGTWLVGGLAVYFLLRSLGSDPGLETIPYLGGVSAVGAIVSVLAIFLPSGLGAREASMYGLLLAVTTPGAALGVTLMNRLAITLVELLLFGVGVLSWRSRGRESPAPG